MAELLLIVRLDGERIAFPADDVESVVELDSLTPVPGVPPHVAGLAALRSRVLTVIDCVSSLDSGRRIAVVRDAVVVVAEGHPYALLVDAVEDVVDAEGEIGPVRTTLGGGWSRVARGMVEAEGLLTLVADVQAFISGPVAKAA
jgi:purine-binding chemotaxis protein CheW